MAKEKLSFDVALKRFKSATQNSMKYALTCSIMSLEHFAEHGDLSKCQAFLDAMPANYVRKAAYLKWLTAHAPVTIEKGTLKKDTSEKALKAVDLDGARSISFWEFAPDPELVVFQTGDVVQAVLGVIKRFENSERYKPGDETAARAVQTLKNAVANVAPKGNVEAEAA